MPVDIELQGRSVPTAEILKDIGVAFIAMKARHGDPDAIELCRRLEITIPGTDDSIFFDYRIDLPEQH